MTAVALAEERLTAMGFPIGENLVAANPRISNDIEAAVAVWPTPGSPMLKVACELRRGLDPAERVSVLEWIERRFTAYVKIGPEADGWDPRPDGGWQLCARTVWLSAELNDLTLPDLTLPDDD